MNFDTILTKWVEWREHLSPSSIIQGFKNLWKWKSVVWNDRDHDEHYFFKIMKFKIDSMIHSFEQNKFYIGIDKDIQNMKRCSLVLDRLINEKQHEIAFSFHDKKWGDPLLSMIESDDKDGLYRLDVNREGVNTEEDDERERLEFRRCMRQEKYLMNQDIEYLFQLLKKHVKSWWW